MEAALIEALLYAGIDTYQALREQGLTDEAARKQAVEDNLRRFREGDADLQAAREGKPVPTSGPSITA
jgi:hypothetical protein